LNNKQQLLIQEFKDFHAQLSKFRYAVEKVHKTRMDTGSAKRQRESIRTDLVRKSGKLKPIVVHLTGKEKQYGQQFNEEFDIWTEALGAGSYPPNQRWSLGALLDTVNEAIGRLEVEPESKRSQSTFSNRTLSCIIEILADGYTDSKLRTFFFKYNLLDNYEQSGQLTAKRRKVNDVFQYLCAAGDTSSGRTLESIVREVLKEFYPRKEVSQIRRQRFFEKFPDLDTALRADGFHVHEGELIPIISSFVEPVKEEALVETLLDKYGFGIAKNHLKQSYENYVEGNWEAANGALRSFLQDVFDQIALLIAPGEAGQKAPGGDRRQLLQEKGFIESNTEAKLVSSFFQFASYKGSHPGISNESDSRLRRYMAVALASYYLEKSEGFNVRNI